MESPSETKDMFTQLATPLPIYVEDKGSGSAFAVIDYGPEHNLIWVTIMDDTGEIWCAPNPKVRAKSNWTMGRTTVMRMNGASLKSPVVPKTCEKAPLSSTS